MSTVHGDFEFHRTSEYRHERKTNYVVLSRLLETSQFLSSAFPIGFYVHLYAHICKPKTALSDCMKKDFYLQLHYNVRCLFHLYFLTNGEASFEAGLDCAC